MSVDADLHDLRPQAGEPVPALDPDSYAASQAVARQLRGAGSNGIAYPSIRHPSGEASRSSTQTARRTPYRGGTSTITGKARGLTSSVMPAQGRFSGSSICRPILSDRIDWVSGRVL